jgi:phosphatidylinositol kinase/protein kinase (PI-3  family)
MEPYKMIPTSEELRLMEMKFDMISFEEIMDR